MQGLATLEYGLEYMGDFHRLVMTPAMERNALAIAHATCQHTVACTFGAVSTGKTGIIRVGHAQHERVACQACRHLHHI